MAFDSLGRVTKNHQLTTNSENTFYFKYDFEYAYATFRRLKRLGTRVDIFRVVKKKLKRIEDLEELVE